jgi:cation diffusion facilitator CzcD-associated flavoprotein CzcO
MAAVPSEHAGEASPAAPDSEELDVLVVGAGLSGICAARYLQRKCAGLRFAMLESRAAIGGTWDLFRYPGVRSDSDMHTLSYAFRPWTGDKAIAAGADILEYLRAAAREEGVEQYVRFGHRLVRASWDSGSARWTVTVERDGLPAQQLRCRFLMMCTGYYDYAQGHRPHFEGEEDFAGTIVHPQFWPPELDYRGKRVLVIGSGATAMTLVPSLAQTAAHVCMVQRSPTWVVARPARDWCFSALRRVLPLRLASRCARLRYLLRDLLFFNIGRHASWLARWYLDWSARRQLGPDHPLDPDFRPRYAPWAQRLCLIQDGDLFAGLRERRVSIETGEIERLTAAGLRLRSGRELPADIIVSATGLKMELLQGIEILVDGQRVALGDTISYRGCMYSGIPNLVSAFGYSNASWTLRAELVCQYACRLLARLRAEEGAYFVPVARGVAALDEGPLNLSAGYVIRALDRLPRQGDREPWRTGHNYLLDFARLRFGRLDDGALELRQAGAGGAGPAR